MAGHKPVYLGTRKEAERFGDMARWQESHDENSRCANAIQKAIEHNGNQLTGDMVKPILEEFGYSRVFLVCANTIQRKRLDGGFSRENKAWAKSIYVPPDKENQYLTIEGRSPQLNLFLDHVLREYQALGMFDASHCEPGSEKMDYTGRTLVIRPECLTDSYKAPENQLVVAEYGDGCNPHASGMIYGRMLNSGEEMRFVRESFVGAIKDECLPEWAEDRLTELSPDEYGNQLIM